MGIGAGQAQPIGIDIGRDSVKLLQAQVCDQTVAVRCAASEPLPPEVREDARLALPAATQLIRRMLRSHPFRGRRAVAALPRHLMYVKNLRLPAMPAGEMESVVRFEAAHMFPFASEQARVQFLTAGEVRQGTDVRQELIVLSAQAGEVDGFVEQLHACGLRVESLDAEPCALFRSFERFLRRREDEQQVQVLCDVGYERSGVVIGRGRDMTFYKRIDMGGRHFTDAVARKLSIGHEDARALRRRMAGSTTDDPQLDPVRQAVRDAVRPGMEELARELSLCLRYHSVTFRGCRPARVLLMGGEAHDGQLLETLQQSISIPVEVGWPSAWVERRARAVCGEHLGPQWSVALGLSLKLTRGCFSQVSRPGSEPVNPVRPGTAEVIDLDERIGGGQPLESAVDNGQSAGERESSSLLAADCPMPTRETEAAHA